MSNENIVGFENSSSSDDERTDNGNEQQQISEIDVTNELASIVESPQNQLSTNQSNSNASTSLTVYQQFNIGKKWVFISILQNVVCRL